jgi:hypothetical protein
VINGANRRRSDCKSDCRGQEWSSLEKVGIFLELIADRCRVKENTTLAYEQIHTTCKQIAPSWHVAQKVPRPRLQSSHWQLSLHSFRLLLVTIPLQIFSNKPRKMLYCLKLKYQRFRFERRSNTFNKKMGLAEPQTGPTVPFRTRG